MDLFTGACPVCGGEASAPFRPCRDCRSQIENCGFTCCDFCGMDLAGADQPCPACRDAVDRTRLDGIRALGSWSGALREWLSILKYGGDSGMAEYLGERLAEELRTRWPGIPVVPVPPRFQRIFREGFDPVDTMARRMSRTGIAIQRLLIRRGRAAQKNLDRQTRLNSSSLDYRVRTRAAVRGSFVLVDDVMTTGATLNHCAGVLKRAGADTVYGIVVCRD